MSTTNHVSLSPEQVKLEVLDVFGELHGMSHPDAVSRLGVVATRDLWLSAERLARQRVGAMAWQAYRNEMGAPSARASRRAANGNADGSTAMRTASENVTVLARFTGRGSRRRSPPQR